MYAFGLLAVQCMQAVFVTPCTGIACCFSDSLHWHTVASPDRHPVYRLDGVLGKRR